MVDSNGTTYYSYDENSRLVVVTYPGQSQITFGYDWVGSRLNPSANPNLMEYNDADQLIRWPNHHEYTYGCLGEAHGAY